MFQHLRKNYDIEWLLIEQVFNLPEPEFDIRPLTRKSSGTFDRGVVGIDPCELKISTDCQWECQLRPIAAADIQHTQRGPWAFGKSGSDRPAHKPQALGVAPQIFDVFPFNFVH